MYKRKFLNKIPVKKSSSSSEKRQEGFRSFEISYYKFFP